jgi:hypothetical protein
MYKVKVTSAYDNSARILRQTPGCKGISPCGKYQFFVDDDTSEADFWVVRNKTIKSRTTCKIAPENTILMLSEPKPVVNYPKRYRDQFGVLYSCQEGIEHKNVVYTPAMLPWYVGKQNQQGEYLPDYDQLKGNPFPEKTKLISVITSNKAFTQGHQDRIDFVEKLKAHYGDKLDVFGRGINGFEDKWDVLAPYKYHIAIENSSSRLYWTEKISDCYLTGTFPIYYGCTNLEEYFPESAYRKIDIYNIEEAIAIIDEVIGSDAYEKSQDALKQCKDLVLDDYNIINRIVECCDKLDPNSPKKMVTLKPSITVLDWHNFYLYFIERNILWARRTLKSLFRKKSILKSR